MQAALENQGFVVENEINLAGLAPKMDGCVALDVRQLVVKAAHLAASETGRKKRCLSPAYCDKWPFPSITNEP